MSEFDQEDGHKKWFANPEFNLAQCNVVAAEHRASRTTAEKHTVDYDCLGQLIDPRSRRRDFACPAHLRSLRSSASSSNRICRERCRCSGSSRRRSIAGMTGFDRVGLKLSKTSRRSLIGSGTAFPTTAFEQPELSPRELATRFTDTNRYYVSESSVYRLLKAHDLIGSPAFIIIKAADEFRDKTTAQTTTVRGEARQHLRADSRQHGQPTTGATITTSD